MSYQWRLQKEGTKKTYPQNPENLQKMQNSPHLIQQGASIAGENSNFGWFSLNLILKIL